MASLTVALGETGIATTQLGFGCANLFASPSAADRLALLGAAYDAGVRHFDVAPMYGLGRAEAQLAKFLRSHRDVVVSTKFGIRPTALARGLAGVQMPVRQAFKVMPMLRQQARESAAGPRSGGLGPLLYAADGYSAAAARSSLERSLRALGIDQVDLFLLHDPAPGSVPSAEVAGYLNEARLAGLIRSWGIAGEAEPTLTVTRSFDDGVPVIQLRDDLLEGRDNLALARTGGSAVITFGVLGNALGQIVRHLSTDDERRKRWDGQLGADCAEPEVAASFLLRTACRRNDSGVVLFCTSRPGRIAQAVEAAQLGADDPALDVFAGLVTSELMGTAADERPPAGKEPVGDPE